MITLPCFAQTVVLFPRRVMGLLITTGPSNSPGGSAAVPPAGVPAIISLRFKDYCAPFPEIIIAYTFTP